MGRTFILQARQGGKTCETIEKLAAQRDALLTALEFYAHSPNWENHTLYKSGKPIPNSSDCARDAGYIARAAIAQAKENNGKR